MAEDVLDPTALYRVRDGAPPGRRVLRAADALHPGKRSSTRELSELAPAAGFVDIDHRPTADDRGVLLARKPAR